MKKILSIILLLTMIISMNACGSASGPDETKENSESLSQPAENKEESQENIIPESNVSEATIEETVLFEDNGIKMTVKGLDPDNFMGPALKVLIENNSDESYTIQARNTSINGYMVETVFSCDVAPGKKANDSIIFMESDLTAANIEEIANIETSFHIFNTENWEDAFDTEVFSVKTSLADDFNYLADDSGELLYEDDLVRVISKGLSEKSSFMGPGIVLYVENKSDLTLIIQARDTSINGFMVDSIFSPEIAPGKQILTDLTFMDTELKENDIAQIEEVELSFHIFDSNDWETAADTDPIHISFK